MTTEIAKVAVAKTNDIDVEEFRKSVWVQETGVVVSGYEREVIVLISKKQKRFLFLVDADVYEDVRTNGVLARFSAAIQNKFRLKPHGIYVGTADENLLLQSRLQQEKAQTQEQDRLVTGAYRNFDHVVGRAIAAGASDVHFEFRDQNRVAVRMRVHGKLRNADENDLLASDYNAMLDAVCAAYNSRAEASSRSHNHFDVMHHQSCSIPFTYNSRRYQVRFQSIKENRGVDVILRVLLNEAVEDDILSLTQLGYSADQIQILEDAVYRSPGLLIVAGETGSGKSTTLRTLMSYERNDGKKFFSIEDPVEYIQPHVTQIPIQRKAESSMSGETPFGAASKVLLRGDPDKVMPGEIRDVETGSFAKSMTETGHQVLSTIHASSCFGIIPRLISKEIGMPLSAIAAPNFLTALVYQKLMPVLCSRCKRPARDEIPGSMAQAIQDLGIALDDVYVEGEGCGYCKGRGTSGQTVIAEICDLDPELLDLIRQERFWEAEARWRVKNRSFYDDRMVGRSAIEHALHKMAQGLIDPRDVESAFYRLTKYRDTHSDDARHA